MRENCTPGLMRRGNGDRVRRDIEALSNRKGQQTDYACLSHYASPRPYSSQKLAHSSQHKGLKIELNRFKWILFVIGEIAKLH